MRVVLDTNILVSAFLSPEGRASEIVSLAWQGKLQICYSQEIINEYNEVLSRPLFKFKMSPNDIEEVIEAIKKDGLFFEVKQSDFHMPDETDRVFYDVAKASGAFLITGNKKHYPDEPFIVTLRDFADTVINKTNFD